MEKNLPAVFDISSNFQIDKQDIVTVAIARGEKKIREKVKEAQAAIAELNKEIDSKIKFITKHGEAAVDEALEEISFDVGVAITALEKYGIKAETRDREVDINAILSYHKKKNFKPNHGAISIHRDRQQLLIKSVDIAITDDQIRLIEEHAALQTQKEQLTTEAVGWKKKLSDMPAFERQMRAVVVQDEMNKTENGKAILAALDKNFEDAILMIG